MEDIINTAVNFMSSADVYIIATLALLAALAGIAKLTKTDKDDKIIERATALLNKVLGYVGKKTTVAKK